MTRDNLVFRSIPFFTGSLAFVPACNDDGNANTNGDESSSSSATVSASESSSDGADETSSTDDGSTDPDSSTSAADEESSSSDSGDPVCGDGTCGAVAPIGWFGPVVYARGELGVPPPACPEGIDDPGPTVLDGFFDPGPAVCSCSCELSMPLNCNARMTASSDAACTPVCDYYSPYNPQYCYGYSGNDTVTENCLNIDVPGFVRFTANQYYYYGGGYGAVCEQEEEEAIPPFSWDASISTCRIPDTALVCAEGVCLPPIPPGFESKWCIYQTGDLECTDANFPVKSTFWSDVEDTRGCTNCQCGTADQSCEGLSLQVFGGPDCAGEPVEIVPSTNVCTAALGQSVAGDFGEDGGCPVVEAPMAQGTIAPTGPFTFCCNE